MSFRVSLLSLLTYVACDSPGRGGSCEFSPGSPLCEPDAAGSDTVSDDANLPDSADRQEDSLTDSDSEVKTVKVSGMAYVKNSPNPVVGGTVSMVELPSLTTTTDASGRWTLEVEEGSIVTPFIVAEGFVTTHTQTLKADAEVANVHFQMIPPTLFEVLAGAIGIEPDPAKCQISTEVTSLIAQDLTVAELVSQRPYGVEGATISIDPPAGPITFFEFGEPFDLPNAELTATTASGGLASTQVDPGVYTIAATHTSRTFSSITVTCAAGRFVNATAPHGLHETSN